MAEIDYDLVVIGSGPAGEKGAAQAAYWGKRVAIIEKAPYLGGAGINTGTLPSKTLRETALYFSGLRQRGLYGIDYSLKDDLTVSDFLYRQQVVVENERRLIKRNLERHNIDLVRGFASMTDAHHVQVREPDGKLLHLSTDKVLLATGSSPYRPTDVPFDHPLIHDSDTILRMDRIPHRLAIIGGGVIGTEYASIFTALGVTVTLIDGRERLLGHIDFEIGDRLKSELERLGLRFIMGQRVRDFEPEVNGVGIVLDDGTKVWADIVLYAAGRKSNVEGLNLEAIGVELGPRGLIEVNQHYQTAVQNIYAAGDVIGFPALASTSMEQARVAMVHAFALQYKEGVSKVLPYAIYTIPEIAMVGMTEEECQEKGTPYLVGRSFYDKSPRGLIIGDISGMLKLVFSAEDKRLLGAHHIGELSSELVHIGAQVLSEGGAIDAFIDAVYNYPTLADSYKYAAYDGLGHWERLHQNAQ